MSESMSFAGQFYTKKMRVFPSEISSCTISLEVDFSACADNKEHRNDDNVPPNTT